MRSDSGQWSSETLEPDCERAQLLISRHIDGEANAADAQALRAHIGACKRCRKALEIQTAQSQRVALALQTLWPDDAAARNKERFVSAERFRGAILRAASFLIVIFALLLMAQRTHAPTVPAKAPAAATEAEKDKPKVAEVEPGN